MKQNLVQQFLLYRYRYVLGYGLFALILVLLLVLEIGRIPSGLTQNEINSTVTSSALQINKDIHVVNLPYHALQKISVHFLGLNELAIKLPSIIVGLATGLGLLLLLRRWFKPNVAIISGLISITISTFLLAGRTGTPDIMIVFWSIYLLLFATFITQATKGQFGVRLLLGALIGVSLYTPLTIYILGAAFIAGLLHPHTRYTLRRYGGPELAGMLFLFALVVAPLVYGIWRSPNVGLDLIGVPQNLPTATEYAHNLWEVFTRLAGFWAPYIGEYIQPAFSLATLLLIALGFLRSLADYHATRTYALLIWTAVLLPLVALKPDDIIVLFVPAVLFMAIGIQTLVREWYSLFPRNPYARVAGLLPLIALIGGLWHYNYTTYFNGYRYSPDTTQVFNNDLSLINKELSNQIKKNKAASIDIVVPQDKVAFYSLLTKKCKIDCTITVRNSTAVSNGRTYIVSHDTGDHRQFGLASNLLASPYASESLRWHVYTR